MFLNKIPFLLLSFWYY